MYLVLSRVMQRLYARVSGLTWDIVLLMTVFHFAVSWGLLALIGSRENRERRDLLVLLCHHGDDRWLWRLLAGHRGWASDHHRLDHARRHRPFYDNNCQGRAKCC